MIGLIFSAALFVKVILDAEAMGLYETITFLIFSLLFYLAGKEHKTYIYKEANDERDKAEDPNKT